MGSGEERERNGGCHLVSKDKQLSSLFGRILSSSIFLPAFSCLVEE